MTTATRQLLDIFDSLPDANKHEVTIEILRRFTGAVEEDLIMERLELIEQIWDSLPEQVDPEEIPSWHLELLAKRLAAAESQPGIGEPWRDVLGPLEACH